MQYFQQLVDRFIPSSLGSRVKRIRTWKRTHYDLVMGVLIVSVLAMGVTSSLALVGMNSELRQRAQELYPNYQPCSVNTECQSGICRACKSGESCPDFDGKFCFPPDPTKIVIAATSTPACISEGSACWPGASCCSGLSCSDSRCQKPAAYQTSTPATPTSTANACITVGNWCGYGANPAGCCSGTTCTNNTCTLATTCSSSCTNGCDIQNGVAVCKPFCNARCKEGCSKESNTGGICNKYCSVSCLLGQECVSTVYGGLCQNISSIPSITLPSGSEDQYGFQSGNNANEITTLSPGQVCNFERCYCADPTKILASASITRLQVCGEENTGSSTCSGQCIASCFDAGEQRGVGTCPSGTGTMCCTQLHHAVTDPVSNSCITLFNRYQSITTGCRDSLLAAGLIRATDQESAGTAVAQSAATAAQVAYNLPVFGPGRIGYALDIATNGGGTNVANVAAGAYYYFGFNDVVDSSNRLFYQTGLSPEDAAAYRADPLLRIGDAVNVGGFAVGTAQSFYTSIYQPTRSLVVNSFNNAVDSSFSDFNLYYAGSDAVPLPGEYYLSDINLGVSSSTPPTLLSRVSDEDYLLTRVISRVNRSVPANATLEELTVSASNIYNEGHLGSVRPQTDSLLHAYDQALVDFKASQSEEMFTLHNQLLARIDQGNVGVEEVTNISDQITNLSLQQQEALSNFDRSALLPTVGQHFDPEWLPANVCRHNSIAFCGSLTDRGYDPAIISFQLPDINSAHAAVVVNDPFSGMIVSDPTHGVVMPYNDYMLWVAQNSGSVPVGFETIDNPFYSLGN